MKATASANATIDLLFIVLLLLVPTTLLEEWPAGDNC